MISKNSAKKTVLLFTNNSLSMSDVLKFSARFVDNVFYCLFKVSSRILV